MAMNAQQRVKVRKLVQELKQHRANHTEFVSVYIPAGYDMNKITTHLYQEMGTAENIKSTSTRKNVKMALERMIQHLKTYYPKTPSHGVAVFSGNVASREGKEDIKVWSIEPPVELGIRMYRCEKEFVVDVLEGMLQESSVYALVVVDRREATIGLLRGKTIVPLVDAHSMVPGKFKAGGQCLHPKTLIGTSSPLPLNRLQIGDSIDSFDFKNKKIKKSKIVDTWTVKKSSFIKIILEDNTTIISSKDHLFFLKNKKEKAAEDLTTKTYLLKIKNNKLFPIRIKSIKSVKKKINLIDISVKNKNFIANGILVHNSAQRFHRVIEGMAKDFYKKVGDLMKDQLLEMKELKGIIIGGPGPTKEDFINGDFITNDLKKRIIGVKDLSYTGEYGLQELLDKSQDLLAQEEVAEEKKYMEQFFTLLAKQPGKVAYGEKEVEEAIQMGMVDTLLVSESLGDDRIDKYGEEADKEGTKLIVISVETREGVQLKELGGIAALLRYERQG